jgi:hypothetical protein
VRQRHHRAAQLVPGGVQELQQRVSAELGRRAARHLYTPGRLQKTVLGVDDQQCSTSSSQNATETVTSASTYPQQVRGSSGQLAGTVVAHFALLSARTWLQESNTIKTNRRQETAPAGQ